MSEVHDREREARRDVFKASWQGGMNAALDAYRDAVEARVRWDQQAQAEANG